MSLVSFVKVNHTRHEQLKQAIEDSLNLIHYLLPSKLENIVIKPNMCYYWDYSTGQTTDPKFVGALNNSERRTTRSIQPYTNSVPNADKRYL